MGADWQAPTELPDLRRVGIIALDTETKDGGLLANRGSGWPFGDGYICGVSVAYRADGEIRAHYFPLRHPDSQNFDREQVFQWLKDLVASDVRIVTQNGLYDWGWLRTEADIKMPPSERLEEIGALATIVDENRFTLQPRRALRLARPPRQGRDPASRGGQGRRLQDHQEEPAAILHLATAGALRRTLRRGRRRQHARAVREPRSRSSTRRARATPIGSRSICCRWCTRCAGAESASTPAPPSERAICCSQKRDAVFAELSEKLGARVGMDEIGRTKWLAQTFDTHGITYPRTEKGNPSFTAGTTGWMHKHPHWLPRLIVKADRYNNAAVKFLENYILGHAVNGRIHAEIHPHRSDDGGTRSLRFSYSDPPLQLMPSHDEELAPLIRGVFLPEEGEVWAKPDISQQEFRFIVHYAVKHGLRRAKEAADRYRNDPDTDFHQHGRPR